MGSMSSKRSRNRQNQHALPSPPVAAESTRAGRGAQQREAGAASSAEGGNPHLIVVALIGVSLFLFWYYHLTALNQMKDLVGLTMPDHLLGGYGQGQIDALRAAMDGDALGQLSWVHKTAGTLFTLFAALATAVSIGLYAPKGRAWRALYVLPVVFAGVAIWQNILVDNVLGGTSGAVGLASTLTVLGFWLLIACVLVAAGCGVGHFVREFRRRWADPTLQGASR